MPSLGTVSFQGTPDSEITPEFAMNVGKTLGMQYKTITVGQNLRPSSKMVFEAFAAGAMSMGAEIHDAGTIPTPVLPFISTDSDCCVMIGNPEDRMRVSGITLLNTDGRYFNTSQMFALNNRLSSYKAPCNYNNVGSIKKYISSDKEYINKVSKEIGSVDCQIILDCASDSASIIAPIILTDIGADTVAINCQIDGRAPGREPNLDEPNLRGLSKIVKTNYGSIGIALNGDGTRIAAIDEDGRYVDGTDLMSLFIGFEKPRSIAVPVDTSMSVTRSTKAIVNFTPLGSNFIGESVKNNGLERGGCGDGSFVFSNISLSTDGIMAAALLSKIATESSIREMLDESEKYPIIRESIKYVENREFIAKKISSRISDIDYETITTIDGWRVDLDSGWALIRFSENGQDIDITVEGTDKVYAASLMEIVKELVTSCT